MSLLSTPWAGVTERVEFSLTLYWSSSAKGAVFRVTRTAVEQLAAHCWASKTVTTTEFEPTANSVVKTTATLPEGPAEVTWLVWIAALFTVQTTTSSPASASAASTVTVAWAPAAPVAGTAPAGRQAIVEIGRASCRYR